MLQNQFSIKLESLSSSWSISVRYFVHVLHFHNKQFSMANTPAFLYSSHAKLIRFFLNIFLSIFCSRSFSLSINLKWGKKSNNFNNKKSFTNYNKRNEIIFSLFSEFNQCLHFFHYHFYLRHWINLSVEKEKCILQKCYIRNIFSEMDQNWYIFFLKKKKANIFE